MPGEPTVIYSAANPQQAHLIKGLLEQQGIQAWVVNDAMQIAGGELPLGWTAAARVVVSDENAVEARRFAEEFDLATSHESPDEEVLEPQPLQPWPDWPVCPKCDERRPARCHVCGASGASFPLADIVETESGHDVLLKCEDCDDLIKPQWYRLCARCGHDFGDGIEVGQPARRLIEFNRRGAIVVAALTALAALLIGYFFWLFSHS
jgi:hypothetical protein